MQTRREISGPVIAIVTPFRENLEIEDGVLAEYLAFLAGTGVQAIVVGGTTGEFPSLGVEERLALLASCRRSFSGTIIHNVSASALADVRRLLEGSVDHADYGLILPPYYFARPEADGVRRFLAAALAAARLPMFLYNFPQHTQFTITPRLVRSLREEFENLVGIKDSGGSFENAVSYREAQRDLRVYVGADAFALRTLKAGLSGSMSGGAGALPECLVGITRSFQENQEGEARRLQMLLDRWTDWRKKQPFGEIAVTKAVLGSRIPGFPAAVRPPFIELPRERCAEGVKQLNQLLETAAAR